MSPLAFAGGKRDGGGVFSLGGGKGFGLFSSRPFSMVFLTVSFSNSKPALSQLGGPFFSSALLPVHFPRSAGQHQFPGLEEGSRREGRSFGGFCYPSLDCYRPVSLETRPVVD
jgi:hypothetical protein